MSLQNPFYIKGKYNYRNREFIPDEGMKRIEDMKKTLKLLADDGPCVPSFFVDPDNGTYWEYIQYQNYETELKQVTREYIKKNHPTVNCDQIID